MPKRHAYRLVVHHFAGLNSPCPYGTEAGRFCRHPPWGGLPDIRGLPGPCTGTAGPTACAAITSAGEHQVPHLPIRQRPLGRGQPRGGHPVGVVRPHRVTRRSTRSSMSLSPFHASACPYCCSCECTSENPSRMRWLTSQGYPYERSRRGLIHASDTSGARSDCSDRVQGVLGACSGWRVAKLSPGYPARRQPTLAELRAHEALRGDLNAAHLAAWPVGPGTRHPTPTTGRGATEQEPLRLTHRLTHQEG